MARRAQQAGILLGERYSSERREQGKGSPSRGCARPRFFTNAEVILGRETCRAKPTGTLALPSGATALFANPLQGKLDSIRHWRMLLRVHFIETPVFTRQITALLDDGDYRQLQVTLALKPAAGDLIRGSGGLRKIRWAVRGRGKSGGIRVIYYLVDEGEIYFLFAYAKNEQEDLDSRQLRILRNLVKEEFE